VSGQLCYLLLPLQLLRTWAAVSGPSPQRHLPHPQAGCDNGNCDGLRGIAAGTLEAKLFACIMEQRISDWAKASGSRAAGQFGFRRQRSIAQAALVLRCLQDQYRSSGQQCIVRGYVLST